VPTRTSKRPLHPLLGQLGERVVVLRQRKGLSQEALADAAGIDRSYMSGIERGVRNVSVLVVARLARALKVPLSSLLERQS